MSTMRPLAVAFLLAACARQGDIEMPRTPTAAVATLQTATFALG